MKKRENKNKDENSSKVINLEFLKNEIESEQELNGQITVNYSGRFDSISINAQIENSSDMFTYIELENKKISHPYSRFSIMKKDLQDPSKIKFKAITKHIPTNTHSNVKFRIAIIQEHKEIASDVRFVKIKK